jgi:nucleotide-binding universal stress UspA family protein
MNIERLLIAVDFSETALAAARYAVQSFAPGAEVVLLHVIDPPTRPRFARDKLPAEDRLEATAREFASTHMRELAGHLSDASSPRLEIRVGKPFEVIASVAQETRATLIVIGPHGDRPRPWRFLGTTADRVVRTAPVPVLVATAPTTHPPRRILVPIDDDAIASPTLEWTRTLADRFDADVNLLHVWSNAVYSHVASMSYAESWSEAEARREIEKELHNAAEHWLNHLARTGVARERVTSTVAWGSAGDVIIETAETAGAELIILGRNGTGLVSGALLGRTTATVLHGARCPVLVVADGTGDG